MSNVLWERKGPNEIPASLFSSIGAVTILIGIIVNIIGAAYTREWLPAGGILIVALLFMGFILATMISLRTSYPGVYLIAYLALAFVFSVMVGLVFRLTNVGDTLSIYVITGHVVVISLVIGLRNPSGLKSWRAIILGVLMMILVGNNILLISSYFHLPIDHELTTMEWVGTIYMVLVFLSDRHRSVDVPYTLTNALHTAPAYYLDIFLWYLRSKDEG